MKNIIVISVCVISICMLEGCGGKSGLKNGKTTPTAQAQIDDEFPDFLAGTWNTEDGTWEINLSADGRVVYAILPTRNKATPNTDRELEMVDGSKGELKTGPFSVTYSERDRVMAVSIDVQRLLVKNGPEVIDGNSLDIFTGPISEDGKTWTTQRLSLFDYGPRFPMDPNMEYPPVIWKKKETAAGKVNS